jgi:ABC-type dipeptide/oligopeptide/nickel transport systems, permease components
MVCFIFILLRISPGDPSLKFVSPELSPNLAQKVKESFGLNKTVFEQFVQFISNIFSGNFGVSYDFRKPVVEVMKNYLLFTVTFSLISFIIQLTVSYFLALLSIKKMNGFIDRLLGKTSLVLYAIPSFVIGVFLIFIFSEKLKLLPASGLISYGAESLSGGEKFTGYVLHLILPLITLSLGGIAVFYKYLRDNLDEVFNKPFVLNLYGYGLSKKEITRKHVIPGAISPLISVAGVELGILFSGALITEVIFGLPGMGRLTVNAILSRDYPLVVGCTFVSGVLIIVSNFLADMLKAKLDKRLVSGMLN